MFQSILQTSILRLWRFSNGDVHIHIIGLEGWMAMFIYSHRLGHQAGGKRVLGCYLYTTLHLVLIHICHTASWCMWKERSLERSPNRDSTVLTLSLHDHPLLRVLPAVSQVGKLHQAGQQHAIHHLRNKLWHLWLSGLSGISRISRYTGWHQLIDVDYSS